MDGSDWKIVISGNYIEWLVDIVIDFIIKKLFWIDVKFKVIKYCDMDGFNVCEVVN